MYNGHPYSSLKNLGKKVSMIHSKIWSLVRWLEKVPEKRPAFPDRVSFSLFPFFLPPLCQDRVLPWQLVLHKLLTWFPLGNWGMLECWLQKTLLQAHTRATAPAPQPLNHEHERTNLCSKCHLGHLSIHAPDNQWRVCWMPKHPTLRCWCHPEQLWHPRVYPWENILFLTQIGQLCLSLNDADSCPSLYNWGRKPEKNAQPHKQREGQLLANK